MEKLVLVSILAATIAVPAWAARDERAVRGLKKALAGMGVATALYWIAVLAMAWGRWG